MPVKPKELKFSVNKDRRSQILIANFVDGYASDYMFPLPASFKDALDIKYTSVTILEQQKNVFTQGRNYSFQEGDVIYDTKNAYKAQKSF